MAGDESADDRLYDRRSHEVSLDEVRRIGISLKWRSLCYLKQITSGRRNFFPCVVLAFKLNSAKEAQESTR